jgi:UDP-N-acetyl-2-amino-2-deoxyglucuronate dehydrogenase
MTDKLGAALVGCGGMGKGLARALTSLPDYTLVAGCDLSTTSVESFTQLYPNVKGYTDYAEMLATEKPDVVLVATNNVSHAPLTIQAAEAGVRGVYCEKPMATNLADAQRMVDVCQRQGTALVVNHQRRMLPVFTTFRRLIAEKAIGEVELIRASCAGDILSDGTHLIDTVRALTADDEVKWVFAQIYRNPPKTEHPKGMGFDVQSGWRYGHPVEDGAMAVLQFASGLRAEIFTGTIQPRGRRYQDYEIFGTRGRLHRAGDQADPPLLIQTDDAAGWQPVTVDSSPVNDILAYSLEKFAHLITKGEAHPLVGASGLKDMEIVMAMYESARLHQRIELPLQQMQFPLELMIENGQL